MARAFKPISQEAWAGGSCEFETSLNSSVRSAWKQNLDIHFTAKECISIFISLFSKLHQVYKGMSAINVTVKSVGVIWDRNILSSLIPTHTVSTVTGIPLKSFVWSMVTAFCHRAKPISLHRCYFIFTTPADFDYTNEVRLLGKRVTFKDNTQGLSLWF